MTPRDSSSACSTATMNDTKPRESSTPSFAEKRSVLAALDVDSPRQRLVHLAGHFEDALDDLLFAAHLTVGGAVYATHLVEPMMSHTCSAKGSRHVNACETTLRTCREWSSCSVTKLIASLLGAVSRS